MESVSAGSVQAITGAILSYSFEEVISADDGPAESGCSAEEGAQRVAAARMGAGGMAGGGGTPACPRSSQPHTQAEPRTAAREFGRVSEDRARRRNLF